MSGPNDVRIEERTAVHEPVPLFLSSYEEEYHQQLSEYAFASGASAEECARVAHCGRCRGGVGDGGLLALFSIDSTRAVIVNAKASLGGGGASSVRRGGAASRAQAPAQLPPRVAAPHRPNPRPPDRTVSGSPHRRRRTTANALASASPTRDEIAAAYQSALKGKVAVPEPVAREAARERRPGCAGAPRAEPPARAKPLRQGASIRTNSRRC